MIDALDLLILVGTLRKSRMHWWKKPPNSGGTKEEN